MLTACDNASQQQPATTVIRKIIGDTLWSDMQANKTKFGDHRRQEGNGDDRHCANDASPWLIESH
jgi:hypothetical protein